MKKITRKTMCPFCGRKQVEKFVREHSFIGNEETTCKKCGKGYSTPFNLAEKGA